MTLASRLEKIESSGLIRLAQVDPDLEYIFRHALVQDATYESLLKADRRSLHHAVGQTLERLYAERLDEIAATLGLHFERAEEYEKAVHYLVRAGEGAARVYAVDEAIGLFGHALELIPAAYPEADLIHLYSQYGRVLELAGRFDAAIQAYQQMCAEGVKRQNPRMELDALMAQAILHSTPSPVHDFALALQLSDRALAIARPLDNREAQSRSYWMLMLANMFEGNMPAAVSYGEQSLELARSLENPETLAFVLNDLARTYGISGLPEKSRAVNREARGLWEKLGNLPMLIDNLNTDAEDLYFRAEFDQCIEVALQAYELGKSIRNIWGQTYSLMVLGFVYTELGEISQAIRVNEELLAFDARQTFTIAQVSARAQMADIYGEFGDLRTGSAYALAAYEQAIELASWLQASALAGQARYELLNGNYALAESLFDKATQNYDPGNFITFIPQYVEDARNDLLMHKGQYLAALEGIDKIIAIVDRLGITQCRPEFMLRRARTLVALERRDEALAVLAAAAELCERVGLHRVLWKIYALMGELHAQAGHSEAAQTSRQAARQEIEFLAERCPPALRQCFLQTRAVLDVLEADRSQP